MKNNKIGLVISGLLYVLWSLKLINEWEYNFLMDNALRNYGSMTRNQKRKYSEIMTCIKKRSGGHERDKIEQNNKSMEIPIVNTRKKDYKKLFGSDGRKWVSNKMIHGWQREKIIAIGSKKIISMYPETTEKEAKRIVENMYHYAKRDTIGKSRFDLVAPDDSEVRL